MYTYLQFTSFYLHPFTSIWSLPLFHIFQHGQRFVFGSLWGNFCALHEVALCQGALLHRNLSLQSRCECGLAGFLLLDLYKMLSNQRSSRLGQPRGSMFMSPQTMYNIQGVSLIASVICVSKDPNFHPWKVGSCRLSELPIEEWFSLLRRQSANAQLNCRAFFQASCRSSLKHGRQLNSIKPVKRSPEPPLTEEVSLGNLEVMCFLVLPASETISVSTCNPGGPRLFS